MLLFEWASRFETEGFKLADGKGLREGWDSKEVWKSVEKSKVPPFAKRERWAARALFARPIASEAKYLGQGLSVKILHLCLWTHNSAPQTI